MSKKTVAFHTLGCKVNQYETNAMMQQFIEKGYEIVEFNEKADIYIINTCTVTNMSDRKSRQMLRKAKQKNKDGIIVATGCYAQVAKQELEKIEEIDLILGINEKNEIVKFVEDFINTNKKIENISDVMQQKEFLDFGCVTSVERTRAAIKIQDGCDRFCTYCIIPYARGRVRSRKAESIVAEVTELAKSGIKEIVLTGIHIASYGKDFKEENALLNLLHLLNEIPGLKRIRLGSIEPTLLTPEFVNELKQIEKICDHFHLSLQSGCDETLKRMNRRYTTDEFRKVVQTLRKLFPNAALTTDVIVGFPGETEEEFQKTFDFLKEMNFYKIHVFPYSQRNGTKAAIMDNQISAEIKEKRVQKLIELSDSNEERILQQYINKHIEVLFEQEDGEYIKGHTTNYIEVQVPKTQALENQIEIVEVTKVAYKKLEGLVIKM
ncbi:MAG: tRNA (N(6)-L-threonylcarbamoyladenosine(37)-C(2))-methylthiotransferase MtaB [Clostridia bacterium]|nr:tRNA (N(6)-L-threonylcarbamoyladenosine(37)-C(2))-methylthiotransferase MtaB [Clostridia bacterium]